MLKEYYNLSFRFLEAAAHLYSKLPMPANEEVEDYEFRLRVEEEEAGVDFGDADEPEEAEEEASQAQDVDTQPQPHANRCNICLDGVARVVCIPCNHCCMCVTCADLLVDERCPVCRTTIVHKITVFFS